MGEEGKGVGWVEGVIVAFCATGDEDNDGMRYHIRSIDDACAQGNWLVMGVSFK